MIIGSVIVKIYVPSVHSLKEKRTIVKSLVTKVKNKFNVSIAEVSENDTHQTIVLGFACVTISTKHANSIIDTVINFIEDNTEGDIVDIVREIYKFYFLLY